MHLVVAWSVRAWRILLPHLIRRTDRMQAETCASGKPEAWTKVICQRGIKVLGYDESSTQQSCRHECENHAFTAINGEKRKVKPLRIRAAIPGKGGEEMGARFVVPAIAQSSIKNVYHEQPVLQLGKEESLGRSKWFPPCFGITMQHVLERAPEN